MGRLGRGDIFVPVNPSDAIGAGLAILGSRDILNKLLGPTADYLGEKTKGLAEKCDINLNKIFEKAVVKLGDKINEPGGVNSRVLKGVWEEGRFCEDELTADYMGGILASSRSQDGRDDRGITYLAHIKSLSVYQLRLHYLFYHEVHKIFSGSKHNMDLENREMALHIPHSVYMKAMEFNENEAKEVDNIVRHSLIGLRSHMLIGTLAAPKLGFDMAIYSSVNEDVLSLLPTQMGAELYIWGMGIISEPGMLLNQIEFKENVPLIPIGSGVIPVMEF